MSFSLGNQLIKNDLMTNLQRERMVITPGGGEGVQGCERN